MKKLLSILLSLTLILSCISVGAQTDDAVASIDDEITLIPDNTDMELETSATESVGYFTGYSQFRNFSQTFTEIRSVKFGSNGSTGKDDLTYYTNQIGNAAGNWVNEGGWSLELVKPTAPELFEPQADNRYYSHKHSGGTAANPNFGPWLDVTSMADEEKIHISFMIKNDDFVMDKNVYYAKGNRVNMSMSLVKMGMDGKMTFGYASGAPVSVDYSLNRWYKIDVLFSHYASIDDTVDLYLDGRYITTNTYADITALDPTVLAFIVDKTGAASADPSSFGIDNITADFYSAADSVPAITPSFAYSGFEGMHADSVGTDGFVGTIDNDVLAYTKSTGVFGKLSSDTSIKLSPVSDGSINAYELDISAVKSDSSFAAESQLKFSTSYAYKSGGGADMLMLKGSADNEALYTIDRTTGELSAAGSTDSCTLTSEKWYNLDTILTVNANSTIDYTVNVNGIPEITGTLDIASLQDSGALINKLIINSEMDTVAPGETYLDDMYVEYFTGLGDDKPKANAPVENLEVDLSENGKIFIPAGYSVADILADTAGDVKVYRDNAVVESGSLENALVVVGDLLPVYGYAYVKLKLVAPVAIPGDGTVTVKAQVQSNQADPADTALVAVVYQDGKVYSVHSDSRTCATGNTDLIISDIAMPEDSVVKVYTIDNWTNKLSAFDGQVYELSYDDIFNSQDAEIAFADADISAPAAGDSDAVADSMAASDFDYDNLSVNLSGAIGDGGVKTATLYIIPKADDIDSLSDSKLPVFADVITTDANGGFSIDVKFLADGTAFGYDTYNVYLYNKDLTAPLTTEFAYLSPDQLLAGKKQVILDDVKSSKTWQSMMAVILGEDMEGNVINDNFDLIDPDTSDYSKLDDKEKLFREMFKSKSNITEFDDIASEFERIAEKLRKAQGNSGGGSSFGGGGGSSKPVMNTDKPEPDNNTPSSGAQNPVYKDMSGHWAEIYVNTLSKNGVLNGYVDGTFGPDNSVTRAELAKIISASFGINTALNGNFTDVASDSWYAPYVYGASASGIVTGYDGKFNPDSPVTRQDAALMIHRAISRTHKLGIGYIFFADETSIASYAAEEVSALAQIGIITGNSDNQFMPLSNLTRAEAAALISRAADYIIAH